MNSVSIHDEGGLREEEDEEDEEEEEEEDEDVDQLSIECSFPFSPPPLVQIQHGRCRISKKAKSEKPGGEGGGRKGDEGSVSLGNFPSNERGWMGWMGDTLLGIR